MLEAATVAATHEDGDGPGNNSGSGQGSVCYLIEANRYSI